MELVLTQNDDLLVATTSPPLTIGVISDTHVSARARALPAAVLDRLSGSDIILHAGDLVELSVLATLQAIAPVLAVAGNCDGAEVVKELPNRLLLRVGRWHIGMVHGHGPRGTTIDRARHSFAGATVDVVVFGHSHQPINARYGDVLFFNPGSATDRRRSPFCAVGQLHVTESGVLGEILPL